jgi:hypothetical protein
MASAERIDAICLSDLVGAIFFSNCADLFQARPRVGDLDRFANIAPLVVGLKQAAAAMGVSVSTARRLIAEGTLPVLLTCSL